MSEQEKKASREGASAVVVESAASRHKQPYRPTELQDDSREIHHKRSKAPAVPSVTEELKTFTEDNPNENVDTKERKESESALKHHVSKKLSSSKKKGSAAEMPIPADVELETKVKILPSPSQPIPASVSTVSGSSVIDKMPEPRAIKKEDEDIIEDTTENVRTAAEEKHSEWSDDEEAGGLPRSVSRASRISRAMRQMFCCGMPYEAPSEDNVSSTRHHYSHGV